MAAGAYSFLPPRESPWVRAAVDRLCPVLLAARERVVAVRLAPQDWQRLRGVRGRALLLPNHPSETEPSVMAGLAARLGEPFFYMATHEIFEGPAGWLIRRMGAFSVRRGWPDRASLQMAATLLAERDRKVVIFPEGETHMRGEMILPLHRGAVQIGFWSLQRLQALGEPPRLPLVPLVIAYRYVKDPLPALGRATAGLEAHLGLSPGGALLTTERLLRAGQAVLAGVEREYGIPASHGASFETRVERLYRYMVGRVAAALNVRAPQPYPVHLAMRALFNAAFDHRATLAAPGGATPGGAVPYERRLHARRAAVAGVCLADLWRVQNFMAIGEDYLQPPLTAERAGEILFRLEKEVYGAARTRPPREAVVRVGDPLDLEQHLPAYHAGRKAALESCTAEVATRLRELLISLRGIGRALERGQKSPTLAE
jgi:1-acyl-sn-glycerol-3-phosphate acyltransferase